MPISREPQVSDLGVCDRETANLGLAQQSPRGSPGWLSDALMVLSAGSDFGRFTEVNWINPIAAPRS